MKLLWVLPFLVSVSAFATVNRTDHNLMVKLGQGESSEVDLAKRVVPKATDAEVKEFAQRMISDHGKGFEKLERVAKAEKVSLKGGMDDEHKKFAAKLAKEKLGRPYDRTYMEEMVKDHEKDRSDVKKAIAEIHDREFKAWAEEALKTIEEHLAMAQRIAAKLR